MFDMSKYDTWLSSLEKWFLNVLFYLCTYIMTILLTFPLELKHLEFKFNHKICIRERLSKVDCVRRKLLLKNMATWIRDYSLFPPWDINIVVYDVVGHRLKASKQMPLYDLLLCTIKLFNFWLATSTFCIKVDLPSSKGGKHFLPTKLLDIHNKSFCDWKVKHILFFGYYFLPFWSWNVTNTYEQYIKTKQLT